MPANCLVDTGAVLACLDRDDRWHRLCRDAFVQLRMPLMTSTAVLTELFHLAVSRRIEKEVVWGFLRTGNILLGTITAEDLPHLRALMARYGDHPMDFADATLVLLAERESITRVFTVDRADFETYRINGRRRFSIVPTTRP